MMAEIPKVWNKDIKWNVCLILILFIRGCDLADMMHSSKYANANFFLVFWLILKICDFFSKKLESKYLNITQIFAFFIRYLINVCCLFIERKKKKNCRIKFLPGTERVVWRVEQINFDTPWVFNSEVVFFTLFIFKSLIFHCQILFYCLVLCLLFCIT